MRDDQFIILLLVIGTSTGAITTGDIVQWAVFAVMGGAVIMVWLRIKESREAARRKVEWAREQGLIDEEGNLTEEGQKVEAEYQARKVAESRANEADQDKMAAVPGFRPWDNVFVAVDGTSKPGIVLSLDATTAVVAIDGKTLSVNVEQISKT